MQKFFEDLIKIKSVSKDTVNCKKAITYVENLLKKSGIKIKVYEKNKVYSLVASGKLKKKYKLILSGHLDVVPADDTAFIPKIVGRRMYGRGTSDMKGVDVAMIEVFINILMKHKDADIALILTSDEELGGFDGTKYLVDELGYMADCVFVPDSGSDYTICTDAKGVMHIKFTAKGISAHGSELWLGDNALDKLINVYKELKSKTKKVTAKDRWKTTINLGKMIGGNATNSIPDYAEMYLDYRFPPEVKKEFLLNQIQHTISKYKDVNYKILVDGGPVHTPRDSKYVKTIRETVKKHKGYLPKFVKDNGNSDARFFSAKGADVIMIKPTASDEHIKDEWIDLKELDIFKNILSEFCEAVLL